MNIFYDHQIFSLQTFGGASRLFAELASEINTNTEHHAFIAALLSDNSYLSEKKLGIPHVFPILKIPKRKVLIQKLNDIYSAIELQRRHYDIYHPTYYNHRFLRYAKDKPVVVTFLDMIHEIFLEKYPELQKDQRAIRQKREIVTRATHLIAISESTKRDMVEFYNVKPEKISVVHLGSSFDSSAATRQTVDPYLLYVGTRDAYKNFDFLVSSLAQMMKNHRLQLVCAGGRPFTKDEAGLFSELGITALVKHERVNDAKLATLYTNATAFIFPSLYEGFGIPILESFACGCPCVVSNTSSLPEVGGDACRYIDPRNAESIREAVEEMLFDTEKRAALIEKGRVRLRNFSWRKQALDTIEVYKTLL